MRRVLVWAVKVSRRETAGFKKHDSWVSTCEDVGGGVSKAVVGPIVADNEWS